MLRKVARDILNRLRTPIPLFYVGYEFETFIGCTERVDYIYISKEDVRYGGLTLKGFSEGSRWAAEEKELIKSWRKK